MGTDDLHILQLTDTHLYADENQALLGVTTQASLEAVIRHIEAQRYPVDFVLHSGDITQDHEEASYLRAEQLLSVLKLPVYCVPGNHDDPALMARLYPAGCISNQKNIVTPHWQLILLDSHQPGAVWGNLSQAELDYLEACLKANPAHHALVMFHHHPFPVGSAWLDKLGLRNAGEFWEVISRYPQMNTVLFGHVHQAVEKQYHHIQCYAAPSTSIQFRVGQDDFALDPLPQGYRLLTLLKDGRIRTDVVRLPEYVGYFDKHAKGY